MAIKYLCVHVSVCVCIREGGEKCKCWLEYATTCLWRPDDNFQKLAFTFHFWGRGSLVSAALCARLADLQASCWFSCLWLPSLVIRVLGLQMDACSFFSLLVSAYQTQVVRLYSKHYQLTTPLFLPLADLYTYMVDVRYAPFRNEVADHNFFFTRIFLDQQSQPGYRCFVHRCSTAWLGRLCPNTSHSPQSAVVNSHGSRSRQIDELV